MTHRAALYRVRVRRQREKEHPLLGDIDGAGMWLGDLVARAMSGELGKSNDKRVEARVEATLPRLKQDEVGVSILAGRSGVVSVLSRKKETFARTADTVEQMRSAALFHLPPGRSEGTLALHVPDGRGCKGIVESAIRRVASDEQLVVELGPVVPLAAFRAAVDRGAVERVRLVKHDAAHADDFADAAQWGSDGLGDVALSFPSRRNRFLNRDPLKRFLDHPSDRARRALVEFHGLTFDEVEVTV